jgi:hypothetical protein
VGDGALSAGHPHAGGKNADGEPDLKSLRAFLQDGVAVRRGDHSAARLQMEWERLDEKRRKTGGKSAAQEVEGVDHGLGVG